ncbi:MAG: hypothetical protein ACLFR2_13390, partial [Candidatus Kapaibacterium sp.]
IRTLIKSKANIYTIDTSVGWIKRIKKYTIIKKNLNSRIFIYHVDVGPTIHWGFPAGEEFREKFPGYSSEIFTKVNKKNIDTVLIDGRFRVACTLNTILELHENEKLKIMIHDFWDREKYHIVLKYLDVIDSAERLGVFKIKNQVNLDLVRKDYEKYKYNYA